MYSNMLIKIHGVVRKKRRNELKMKMVLFPKYNTQAHDVIKLTSWTLYKLEGDMIKHPS